MGFKDAFFVKAFLFGIGLIIILVLFPCAVFAGTQTPANASVDSDWTYQDAYDDAYQDIYDTLMEDFDFYQAYGDAAGLADEELHSAVLDCRDLLEVCFHVLVFGDVLLAVLIGCVCASILSRFLRLRR